MKELLSLLFDPKIKLTDEVYRIVRDKPRHKAKKDFLERLWQKYEPYADRGFKKIIAREFHQRFWEMYLACALMEQGHQLKPKKKKGDGPDICLEIDNLQIWVEAVAPKGEQGQDTVSEQIPDQFLVPEKDIILRYTSAIDEKYKKYLDYLKNGIIGHDEAYIIAVNGGGVPSSGFVDSNIEGEIPLIIQAVLPYGPYFCSVDPETRKVIDTGFSYRPEILKKGGSSVSTRIFLDEKHSGISGVLFSNTDVANYPDVIGSDFIFIHNPKASCPLSKGWLHIGLEFWLEQLLMRKSWNQ